MLMISAKYKDGIKCNYFDANTRTNPSLHASKFRQKLWFENTTPNLGYSVDMELIKTVFFMH